ncbi:MAG: hypothetical protein JSR61_05600 [Proteobacteria bacterium]|nr:hypothetical protein [Pseudomonadota bacterium]
MATIAHHPASRRHGHRRRAHAGPLVAPVVVFAAVCLIAALYVAYVLWPRWPDAPVAVDAPSMPITVGGTVFNIEPAAIRIPSERHSGSQNRVDTDYLWPSLMPPDPSLKVIDGKPVNPNERLFALIQVDDGALPVTERVRTIYPRYLAKAPVAGPEGLVVHPFRGDTPYAGEDLVYERAAPDRFVARCSRYGIGNSGTCLLEKRVGSADVTFRFPREWLSDWQAVAAGIDKLLARWRPNV